MSASGDLDDLRRRNKSLLERLARRRDEFRTRDPATRTAHNRDQAGATSKMWKEPPPRHGEPGSSSQRAPPFLAAHGLSSVTRRALSTPRRICRTEEEEPLSSTRGQDDFTSRSSGKDVIRIRSPVRRLTVAGSMADRVPAGPGGDPPTSSGQYADHLMHEGNARTPKSILITPNRNPKREPGHVTFLSSPTTPRSTQWTGRPLLGYDWIAGLLEVNSGVTNKSDEFFSDISEFRRVNKEECVHGSLSGAGQEDSSGSEEEMDASLDTHQCVYCYRVNSRLFISPVGAESACPVCKKRRSRRRVTLDEPAYIRVSIPRSTLLPPYKYRAHRRKSFDPTDTLALPSHCLAGWENAVPSCGPHVNSLDLKTSVEPSEVTAPSSINVTADSTSYYASRARSENLLNMSRSITFHHNKAKSVCRAPP